MIDVDVAVAGGDWPAAPALEKLAARAIAAAGRYLPDPPDGPCEVSLLFTDDAQMQALNAQWRDRDRPTNVLSFAANESGLSGPMLGDIVLAEETIRAEVVAQDKRFDDHLSHLIIHGFLHLVGYDHETGEREAEAMEDLERKICASLAIADPYADT